MLDPIKKTVEVPCSQKQAFTLFVDAIETWWPLDRNSVSAMGGAVAKNLVLEAKLDGRVYEIGHDDTVHEWGRVTCYEPFEKFSMDWHIGLPKENASDVTVKFIELKPSVTQVQLIHSRWEAFGEKAQAMRDGYNKGWVGVFEEAYAAACSAA